ncbi:unnamed protein product, partial [Ectocarpus fasciculatus]
FNVASRCACGCSAMSPDGAPVKLQRRTVPKFQVCEVQIADCTSGIPRQQPAALCKQHICAHTLLLLGLGLFSSADMKDEVLVAGCNRLAIFSTLSSRAGRVRFD